MRYIPVNCIRENQILASDLALDRGRVILRHGVSLTKNLIKRIKQLGFYGVYIDDDISKDLQIDYVISDELKDSAKKEIQSLFMLVESGAASKTEEKFKSIEKIVTDIVDEIIRNSNVMANIVDLRTFDDYTFSHSINVAVISVLLGTALNMNRDALRELAMGALIHDIGKIFIDKDIVNKDGKLTAEEFEEIKKHTQYGYDHISSNTNISSNVKKAVLMHHEQYGGNGYPFGLTGEEIPLNGRIICVADVYDALTSDRPYRKALQPSDAVEYIMSGYNTMFDPAVVNAFTKKVSPYPLGTCVQLSTGEIGIVVQNYESSGLRPKIRLLKNNHPTGVEIDLSHDRAAMHITIRAIANI